MELEKREEKRSVREGYVVLLRASAQLLLPNEAYPTMRAFYQRIVDACMSWTEEIYGERLRAHFLSLTDIRERSHYRTLSYRFAMRVPWQETPYITILCESERKELDGSVDFYRICHTWNTEEETVLPYRQAIQLFRPKATKGEMPFVPDGIYREDDKIVIYKNKTLQNRFLEARLPLKKN